MSDHLVMTICGSTKFRAEIRDFAWEQTKNGILVLFAPFAKEEIAELEQYREELESQWFQKIRISDIIFVFNMDGYIGEATRNEIQYAESLKKDIRYLVKV